MFATKTDAERQVSVSSLAICFSSFCFQEWIDALQASIGSLINNQQLKEEGGETIAPEKKKNTTSTIGMSIIRKVIPGGKV